MKNILQQIETYNLSRISFYSGIAEGSKALGVSVHHNSNKKYAHIHA